MPDRFLHGKTFVWYIFVVQKRKLAHGFGPRILLVSCDLLCWCLCHCVLRCKDGICCVNFVMSRLSACMALFATLRRWGLHVVSVAWCHWRGGVSLGNFAGSAYSHENVCSNPSTAGLLSALPVQTLHPIYEANADLPVTPQSALARCLCKVVRKGPGTAQRCLLQPRCTNCPRTQFTGCCNEAEGNTTTNAYEPEMWKISPASCPRCFSPRSWHLHHTRSRPSHLIAMACVAKHTLARLH